MPREICFGGQSPSTCLCMTLTCSKRAAGTSQCSNPVEWLSGVELSDAFCFEHSDLPLPGCHVLDFTEEQWVPLGCGERWLPGALKVLSAEPAKGGLLSPLQRSSSPHQPIAPSSERACVALGLVRLPGRLVWCPTRSADICSVPAWKGRLPEPESPVASAVAWLLSWASVHVGSRLSARSGRCQDSQATGPPGPVSLTPSRLIALWVSPGLTLCRFLSRRAEEPSLGSSKRLPLAL